MSASRAASRNPGSSPKPRPRLLAIVGDDPLLKEEALRGAIRERVPEGSATGASPVVAFRAPGRSSDTEDGTLAEFFDELRTAPLFGGTKIIVVREADSILKDEGARERALASLRRLPPGVDVILLFDSLPKTMRLAGLVEEVGSRIDCKKPYSRAAPWKYPRSPFDTPLVEWIVERARQRRLSLDPREAFLLAETVGDDLGALASELEKLDLYLGPSSSGARAVSHEHLVALASGGRTFGAYDLSDAVGRGDRGGAMRILRAIFAEGLSAGERRLASGVESFAQLLIGAIHAKLQKLALARAGIEEGLDVDEVAETMRVPPFLRKPFAEEVRARTRAELEAAIRRTLRADLELKGEGEFPGAILERLVHDLTARSTPHDRAVAPVRRAGEPSAGRSARK